MPVNDHLQWVEIKDFSKGLWSTDSGFLMPSDAFQTMTDCHPRQGGGLRAFFKGDTTLLNTTGIVSAANERIIWIAPYVENNGVSYLMLTKHISTGQQRGYTRAVGAGSWTNSKTFTANSGGYNNGAVSNVCTYYNGSTTLLIVGTTNNKDDITEDGWYTVVNSTGIWTKIFSPVVGGYGVIQYQDRLIGPVLNTLWWTDPGSTTSPPAANFLTLPTGNSIVQDIITNIIPYSPTTLLVATAGSGWWVIDGDITDPTVREMGKDHLPWIYHKMGLTEEGVIFIEPENGTFLTQNLAAQFQHLDPNLIPVAYDTNQGFGYQNGYLFAPGGRVYDTETKTWFSLSVAAGSYSAFEQQAPRVNATMQNRAVLIPQFQASGLIATYKLEERTSQRNETYTVKTSPVRDDHGRQLVIREVQVGFKSYNSAATFAVTCGGTTQTSAALGSGTGVVSFLFPARGEYLDVQVAAASNVTNSEAPTIEFIRIGARSDGHQIRY